MRAIPIKAAALAAMLLTGGWRAPNATSGAKVCEDCVRVHMQTLAGVAMNGRRCSTADEANAARYIEGEFRRMGVAGALPGGAYRQSVPLLTPRLAAPPSLEIEAPGGALHWAQGQEMLVTRAPHAASGPLVRVSDSASAPRDLKGAVVFYDVAKPDRGAARRFEAAGAALVLAPAEPAMAAQFPLAADAWRRSRVRGPGDDPPASGALQVMIRPAAAEILRTVPEGARVRLIADPLSPEAAATQNVLAVIHGADRDADGRALLLSAHYDHLGMRNGKLYPGANDDASGTAAVLEFARLLNSGARPRRTVYFALFGCEESGGLGAQYYRAHTPMPLTDLAANIEFEMIGYPDPKRPDTLMLTGWDLSNLGPTLVAHGAKLGDDPYPEQHFFQRSDNYQLALKGVVAQTASGWPLPPTYHQPSDDLDHVDIPFMASAIQSMVTPVRWLLDSDFKPEWLPGKRP